MRGTFRYRKGGKGEGGYKHHRGTRARRNVFADDRSLEYNQVVESVDRAVVIVDLARDLKRGTWKQPPDDGFTKQGCVDTEQGERKP